MANQFTIYTSADASAPVLNPGGVGSIIAVLDACLVNGYGAKAAAGWAKAFSGTNLAAYRAPTGARHYFRIDNATAAASGIWNVQGYESMSDVNTGTHPVTPSGLRILASDAPNPATWVVAADAVTFSLFILGSKYYRTTFGEFYSFVANDPYRTLMRGGNPAAVASSDANDGAGIVSGTTQSGATANSYIDRGHTGVGSAVGATIVSNSSLNITPALRGQIPYPNPSDGGLYVTQLWITDATTVPTGGVRGRERGMWNFLHDSTSVNDRDTVSGTGDLAGRTFLFLKPATTSTSIGVFTIETSATLETN